MAHSEPVLATSLMSDATDSIKPERWLGNFGLSGFRPGQRQVIDAILDGQDTLCIMPTGGGKSLCFQLPTIVREGVTIVISPLIALMTDQVNSLTDRGIPATFINSSLAPAEQQARIGNMINGQYKLVYIAPERLRSNSFMRAVDKIHIQLLAVDEAHCISQWGHDFRPDYARLGNFRKRIGNPQTVALTATATELVQQDIVEILQLDESAKFVTGFARENLFLQVKSPQGNADKDQQLVDFLKSRPGAGIIYASTRKNCEHLVELLGEEVNRKFAFYHAGLPPDKRREVQQRFMTNETEVIVATNAFGMGIDKSDLRFVVHYNLPGSIEAYYQEAGRAGRDGQPSECLMLYSFQDKFIQEFFIDNSYPSKDIIREVYEYLRGIPSDPIEMTLQDIKDDLGLSIGTSGIATCEGLLEKAKAIERLDSKKNSAGIRIDSNLPTLIDLLPRDATTRRHVLRGLEQLVGSFRGERVLFQPQRFADELGMKWTAVKRSISELTKLDAVDYIPPFRGRAVHVVDRKRPFEKLNIDFPELERRQKSEYEKLQRVIKLATTRRCRQLEILEYFGDPDRKACGNCDNCASRPKTQLISSQGFNSDSNACLYAAQVALSGVARTHGRLGKTLIAQMLTGSGSKKVSQLGLSRLSTFGLFKQLRQTDVTQLIEFLINQGYIEQLETTKFRPTVLVTDSGRSLMAGEIHADMTAMMPAPLVKTLAAKLRGKLPHLVTKSKKTKASDKNDHVAETPAIVSNPNDDENLVEVEPAVIEKSAAPVQSEVADVALRLEPDHDSELNTSSKSNNTSEPTSAANHAGDTPLPAENPSFRVDPAVAEPNEPNRPAFYWTWKLLSEGYSMYQVQQVRNIDKATVFDHALRAMENDLAADPKWLLSETKTIFLAQFVSQHTGKRQAQLLGMLPAGVSTEELLYFLGCEKTGNSPVNQLR